MRYFSALFALILLAPLVASANAPPPQERPPEEFKVVVQRLRPGQEAVISVPMRALRGGAGGIGAADNSRGAGFEQQNSGTGTVIAGIAIAMGFVAGGLWLVQRKKRLPMITRTSITAAVLAVSGLAAIPFAFADLLPPQPRNPRPAANVKAIVEVKRGSDSIVIKLTEAQWRQVSKQFAQPIRPGNGRPNGPAGSANPGFGSNILPPGK